MDKCDVLIVGAGLTGSCLARQLKMKHADLKIINVDRKTDFDYWIGESTVEAWEDYMTRVLKLGPHLEKRFIQKHGLRKFFDSEKKDLSIQEMSEFGRSYYHRIPARNIDRAELDQLLVDLNKEIGVDVRLGVTVKARQSEKNAIDIDRENGHVVQTDKGPIKCTYLVDAAGFGSPLAKQLKLVKFDPRSHSATAWGRFKNIKPFDECGDDHWKKRVNYTLRYNSTNHFMYRGYWVWMIPLTENTCSIGVVYDKRKFGSKLNSKKKFLDFLKDHRCMDEILWSQAELVDFKAMGQYSRCADQHFSADRWFLAGMSGLFVEVMGSGTSRLYSETNRMIGELIAADRRKDHKLFLSQIKHYNMHIQTAYEGHFRNLSDLDRYGSFDLWTNFFGANLSKYFNSHLPNCISDLKHLNDVCERHKDGCQCESGKKAQDVGKGYSSVVRNLATEFLIFLDENNSYYTGNQGNFRDSSCWEARPEIEEKIYGERCLKREHQVDLNSYEQLVRNYIQRMHEILEKPFCEGKFLKHFVKDLESGQTLSDIFDLMEEPRLDLVGS